MTADRMLDIPLFPLASVLFPGNQIALRVFELRYLDMVRKCRDTGGAFGVVSLVEGNEVARPGETETFATMGTLARIEQFRAPQAGLYEIVCRGQQRFRTLKIERARNALWTARVEILPEDPSLAVPPDLLHLRELLGRVWAERAPRAGPGVDEAPSDCSGLAHRWLELLPIPMPDKQRLLEIDAPLLRLELVGDWIERLQRQPAA